MKTISQSFAGIERTAETDDSTKELLKAVQANLAYAEAATSNALGAMVILAIVIELLHRTAVGEVSFLGVKVTDLVLVRKLLPVGLAYFFFATLSHFAAHRLYTECLYEIARRIHPSLAEKKLWRFLIPLSPIRTFTTVEALSEGKLRLAFSALSVPIFLAILFGPLLFIVYSYWTAFVAFGPKDLLLWISVALSLLFITKGFLYLVGVTTLAPPDA